MFACFLPRQLFTRHCIHFLSVTSWELLRTELTVNTYWTETRTETGFIWNSLRITSASTTHIKYLTQLLLLKRVHQLLHSNGRGADNSRPIIASLPATSSKHSYFYFCLRYNVLTESLPSNALAIHVTIFYTKFCWHCCCYNKGTSIVTYSI
jgi:hypothetical protein